MNKVKNQCCKGVFPRKGQLLELCWFGKVNAYNSTENKEILWEPGSAAGRKGSPGTGQEESEVLSCLFPLGSGSTDFINFLREYRIALNNTAGFSVSFYSRQREPGKAPNINMLLGPVGDASAKLSYISRKIHFELLFLMNHSRTNWSPDCRIEIWLEIIIKK